jgi:hypothetical protein
MINYLQKLCTAIFYINNVHNNAKNVECDSASKEKREGMLPFAAALLSMASTETLAGCGFTNTARFCNENVVACVFLPQNHPHSIKGF